jgi:exodeoxyribonuclease-3
VKLATWNVNSLRVRLPHLERWVAAARPDVVCLQETKSEDAAFPLDAVQALGFPHVAFWGERTYNGVAILSRSPIDDVHRGLSDGGRDEQARLIAGVVDGVRVVNCYVPNGQEVGSEKFAYKLAWLEALRAFLDRWASPEGPLAVVGDFNIAPAEADVFDPFQCAGQLLFHPDEHARLASVLGFGLTDAFRAKQPFASQFTWWDYRARGFARNQGMRIDHVFVTAPLLARCTGVQIAREVRGWTQPSDHVPVTATFRDP